MSKGTLKGSVMDKVAANKLAEKQTELDEKQKELEAAQATIEDLQQKMASPMYSSPNEKAWLEKMENFSLRKRIEKAGSDDDRGMELTKGLMAYYSAGQDMRRVPEQLKSWGEESSAKYWQKTIDTQTISSGGIFIMERMMMEDFIDFLRPFSFLFQVGVDVMVSDVDKITIPRLDQGAVVQPVGEMMRIKTTTLRFGKITLNAKKFAAILVISNDWKRQAGNRETVFRIIRNDMAAAYVEQMETQVLYGDGTENSLKGAYVDPHWGAIDVDEFPDGDTLTQFRTGMLNANIRFVPNQVAHVMNADLWQVFYNMVDDFGQYRYRAELDAVSEEAPFGRINGVRVFVTSVIPTTSQKTTLFTGKWSEYKLLITRDMALEDFPSGTVIVEDENGNETQVSAIQEDCSFIRILGNYDGRSRRPNALYRGTNFHTVTGL